MWWLVYRLAVDEHTFLFEEDEKRLLLSRLEKNIGRVPPALGFEFEILRQKVIEAEPFDLAELEAEEEEEHEEEIGVLAGSELVEEEEIEELEVLEEETTAGLPTDCD